jgi:uncharacterized SAM-binding protein YcdF (DUF218 family)
MGQVPNSSTGPERLSPRSETLGDRAATGSVLPLRLLTRIGLPLLALAVLAAAAATFSVAKNIERQSTVDEAQPADVILVLGAAEYRGHPSPVLEARLNHALFLYLQGMAPRILTTGGKGGDPTFTEGDVGRAYLSRHGVPSEAILVESEGESTVESTAAAIEIMRRTNMKSCIVVSDGYHIYRVKKMLEFQGISVYGSPRPAQPRQAHVNAGQVSPGQDTPGQDSREQNSREQDSKDWRQQWLYFRQAIAYGLWRIGIPI